LVIGFLGWYLFDNYYSKDKALQKTPTEQEEQERPGAVIDETVEWETEEELEELKQKHVKPTTAQEAATTVELEGDVIEQTGNNFTLEDDGQAWTVLTDANTRLIKLVVMSGEEIKAAQESGQDFDPVTDEEGSLADLKPGQAVEVTGKTTGEANQLQATKVVYRI